MNKELKLKRCSVCGNVVSCEKDVEIICCGKNMNNVVANSVECAVEKHIPTYEHVEDEILVKVNHVMEKDHYIEKIIMTTYDRKIVVDLYPEQEAQARFPYVKGATIYAYCNKHGLWKTEVE